MRALMESNYLCRWPQHLATKNGTCAIADVEAAGYPLRNHGLYGMTSSAPQLPEAIFGRSFRALPFEIGADDASSAQRLIEALVRTFHSDAAKERVAGVAVWALDFDVRQQNGHQLCSRVLYIEKYSLSLASRWPRRYLEWLATDEHNRGEPHDRSQFRVLAQLDHNWSFYSGLIAEYGPLRIWTARAWTN